MSNIHDNTIDSYTVDLKCEKVSITTSDPVSKKVVQVTFMGVFAHYLENPIRGSILMDIDEVDIKKFIIRNKELLEKQWKYAWPMDYNTMEELDEYISSTELKYYVIYASYGLSGWVLAEDKVTVLIGLEGTN